jgi:hypothetical protein
MVPLLFVALFLWLAQPGPTYDAARASAVKRCEAVDPRKSQTGLALNPDGYRSYYEQSACFQRAAVEFRDPGLCSRVRQRRTLLWSSWGYSAGNCGKLVDAAVAGDRKEFLAARQEYLSSHMTLTDVRVERNGNARDYDVMPIFTGTAGHGYHIDIEVVPRDAIPVLIHANGYFVDPGSPLRIFITQREIRERFAAFTPGSTYRVRAAVTYSLPAGGGSRWLSDVFLEAVFPQHERTQSIWRDARF